MGAKVGKVVGIFFAGCYLFFFICFIDAFLGLSLNELFNKTVPEKESTDYYMPSLFGPEDF